MLTEFPKPSVVWVAPNGDHYSMHTADRFDGIEAYANGSLIIHNVKHDDIGNYTCSASNQKGTMVAITEIKVGKSGVSNNAQPTVAPGKVCSPVLQLLFVLFLSLCWAVRFTRLIG